MSRNHMRIKNLFLVIIMSILFTSTSLADNWQSYFPINAPIKGRVMELITSSEAIELTKKMQQSIANHQEWFKTYIQARQPGQPLPYHSNLGITKQEYQKYLSIAQNIGLHQIGTIELKFEQRKDGAIEIHAPKTSPINGIVINNEAALTPFGKAMTITVINNQDNNAPTGPWQGLQWKLLEFNEKEANQKNLDSLKGKEVKFAAGKLMRSDDGIIYYSVRDIDPKKSKNLQITYIVLYTLH